MANKNETVFIECHCENCRYSEDRTERVVLCTKFHRYVSKTFFCKNAERRTDDGKID